MKKVKKYIIPIISISLLGELYFYPFQGDFRFSVGVIALSLIILLKDDLKELTLGISASISVLLLRVFINSLSSSGSLIELFAMDIPAAIYYFIFPLLAYLLSIRKNKDNPITTVPIIFFIDVFSNIIEAILRNTLDYKLFNYILLIALIRSLISYAIYIVFRNQEFIIRKKEHQKRYTQLNTIISNIQAETFYLKKSMKDIEDVMGKSHSLYEKNKDNPEIKETALDIAREVHEIKKDYYRVLKGLENFVENFTENDSMKFKDIVYIIEDNINRYITQIDKDIIIEFKIKNDIFIKNYYLLFTILNNLIINAIDAIDVHGKISIKERIDDTHLFLNIEDNGEGIEEDTIDYIFSPGFTTKFNKLTGESSTGIGLSHVENIVKSLNGMIDVESKLGAGTNFKIKIPLNLLRG